MTYEELRFPVNGYAGGKVQDIVKTEAEPAITALDNAMAVIPRERPTGRDDDPTRARYEAKDKAAAVVSQVLAKLERCMPAISAEIARCLHRSRQIGAGVAGVHDTLVRAEFGEADAIATKQCQEATEQLELARRTVATLHRMIMMAAKVRYPVDAR